jgi:hypothetical protein
MGSQGGIAVQMYLILSFGLQIQKTFEAHTVVVPASTSLGFILMASS